MLIHVDRNLCIGAAPCVAIANAVFELDDEGKAIVINAHGNDDETILLAAEACPVRAVYLYQEGDEKQLYPSEKDSPHSWKEWQAAA